MKKFINLFYTMTFKLFLFLLMVLLSWFAGSKILDIAELYVEDGTGVRNVMFQHSEFDYESSEYLEDEIETTIESVIAYCLHFKSDEHSSDNITIDEEDDLIYTIIYLAQSHISDNIVIQSMIDSGYVELTETENKENGVEIDGKYYIQTVNEKKIFSSYNEHKDEFLDQYRRLIDDSYRETAEYIDSLKGVRYAVVNHKTDKIISNIDEIDQKSSGTSIRSCFGNNDKTLLIVRNAKNPCYESGTMSDYVDYVSECAQSYSEDFDLYLSFGDDFVFRNEISHYEKLHNEMYGKVISLFGDIIFFIGITLIVAIALFIVTGRSEKGGKIIPATLDRLPNDIRLILNLIIYVSLSALYENSVYMLLRSARTDGDYWLGISPEFYAIRANASFVIIICVIVATICTIKRQYKLGTLLTNTYIFNLINGFKKSDS